MHCLAAREASSADVAPVSSDHPKPSQAAQTPAAYMLAGGPRGAYILPYFSLSEPHFSFTSSSNWKKRVKSCLILSVSHVKHTHPAVLRICGRQMFRACRGKGMSLCPPSLPLNTADWPRHALTYTVGRFFVEKEKNDKHLSTGRLDKQCLLFILDWTAKSRCRVSEEKTTRCETGSQWRGSLELILFRFLWKEVVFELLNWAHIFLLRCKLPATHDKTLTP